MKNQYKKKEKKKKKNNDALVKNDARARKSFFFFFEVKKKKSMRGQKMTRVETRNKVLFFFWPNHLRYELHKCKV